jgi:hypothetical protein
MLSDLLEKSLGGKPYIVAALFDRKWINANAAPNANCSNSSGVPYSDPAAKPYYDYYHQSIRNFVDEIRQKWPNGAVLLDIHGNSDYPNAVIRGTRDGLTVTKLLGRYGWPALIGPKSIFGQLAALLSPNYIVMPSITAGSNSQEPPSYNGGYTVFNYGSNQPNGIDAIQIEIGRSLRLDDTIRTWFTQVLATAISAFYKAYLQGSPTGLWSPGDMGVLAGKEAPWPSAASARPCPNLIAALPYSRALYQQCSVFHGGGAA